MKSQVLAAAKRKHPNSLTAYELTLLAVEKTLSPTREGNAEAMEILKKALAVDPGYAKAWVNLAWAHASASSFGADADDIARGGPERRTACGPVGRQRCRGAFRARPRPCGRKGEFDQAKAAFETALRLNPSSFSILVYYVGWASTFGEPERGALLADRAIRLNPSYRPWASGFLRFAYFMAGRYKDALQVMERQTPDNYTRLAWVQRAASFAMLGRSEEARTTLNEALKRHPALTIEGFRQRPEFQRHRTRAHDQDNASPRASRPAPNPRHSPALRSRCACRNAPSHRSERQASSPGPMQSRGHTGQEGGSCT